MIRTRKIIIMTIVVVMVGIAIFGYCVKKKYDSAAAAPVPSTVEMEQKAADQGDAQAQINLGCCYTAGRGVTQSYEKAVEWFQKAAEQGNENAKEILKSLGS
uniref:tetratricopeptide repeat protein n=1 Tax=Eubacterium cellulosolvens TaxID=29322 RepID=UPI000551CDCF|nr:SEL1-like repeat protein [[Eubacterium] cellulosolvens]